MKDGTLGIFLGSLATKFLGEPLGWKGLIALGCVPVVLVVWAFFVPESPRYLVSRGRVDDARKAYAWALQIPVEEVGELPVYEQKQAASYGVIFTKYPKALAIVTLGSFCFILGSFTIQSWGQAILGESFKFDISTVVYMFMGVSLADLLGRLGSAWISDRIGRRKTMLIWGVLGGIGCLIAAFASQMGGYSAGIIFFIGILIAMAFGDGAFGILNAFGAEQFPNEARSTGLGLGYGIGATAKIFGPYMVGAMIGGGKPTPEVVLVPFVIFAVLLFIGAGIYMFAKETKALQLEEV
ncbi:MFS transporter [Actinotignum sp. GS-2025c]|uniref:MFS transporter n=1 Tax=Actinotignum sp. GS-2025c TaxID=3427276 RepID=UPI003F461805